MKKIEEKDDFIIKLAKSVDVLRQEIVEIKDELKKSPLVVKEKEAQLTVSSIWSTAPTEEQKVALHNKIAELLKTNGIRQAYIQYDKKDSI